MKNKYVILLCFVFVVLGWLFGLLHSFAIEGKRMDEDRATLDVMEKRMDERGSFKLWGRYEFLPNKYGYTVMDREVKE